MSNIIPTNIDEAIARIDDWKGKDVKYERITAGITNPNYHVFVDDQEFFLKVPGAGTDFIDRDNCHAANQIASDAGVGAKVFYYFPDTGVEVFDWLTGFRMTNVTDSYNWDITKAAIECIRDFANLPGAQMPLVQSVFEQAEDMQVRAKAAGCEYMPPWQLTMKYYVDRIEAAFKTVGMDLKPCHNDYWYANFMYDDETKKGMIIDMEYGSMNEPIFDLASWGMMFANDVQVEDMVKLYNYGEWDEILFAKTNLARFTLEAKWMWWALMQSVTSDVGYDFYAWYNDKSSRMRYYLLDQRLDLWLGKLEGRAFWRKPEVWDTQTRKFEF